MEVVDVKNVVIIINSQQTNNNPIGGEIYDRKNNIRL